MSEVVASDPPYYWVYECEHVWGGAEMFWRSRFRGFWEREIAVSISEKLRVAKEEAERREWEREILLPGLVDRLNDGEDVPNDEINETIEGAGKTWADLEEAVERNRKRRKRYAIKTAGEEAAREIPTVQHEHDQAVAGLKAAHLAASQQFGPTITAADKRLAELHSIELAGKCSASDLVKYDVWPHLAKRRDQLESRRATVTKEIVANERELSRHQGNLRVSTAQLTPLIAAQGDYDPKSQSDRNVGYRQQLANAQGVLRHAEAGTREMTARLAKLREEAAGLARESEELQELLLQP
ncbi:MAG: hypothetical protein NTY19_30010 [Planctomycetota bacterium]|nr:hypothetical protein [Planctomycetota bacterium]